MQFDYSKQNGKHLVSRNLNHEGEPLVSIITPYYNAEKYFEQTFNCVMNQTFPWFEWIIVDDGSPEDESQAALAWFAEKDSRITTFQKKNGGIASARNAGIAVSHTSIVIPLDADDLIAPMYIETLYYALQQHPDAAWAYTDCVGFGAEEYLWKQPFSSRRMQTENILVCTAAKRKEWLEKVGG